MMGRQTGDQSRLFYAFNLEERIATAGFRDSDIFRQLLEAVVRACMDPIQEADSSA